MHLLIFLFVVVFFRLFLCIFFNISLPLNHAYFKACSNRKDIEKTLELTTKNFVIIWYLISYSGNVIYLVLDKKVRISDWLWLFYHVSSYLKVKGAIRGNSLILSFLSDKCGKSYVEVFQKIILLKNSFKIWRFELSI